MLQPLVYPTVTLPCRLCRRASQSCQGTLADIGPLSTLHFCTWGGSLHCTRSSGPPLSQGCHQSCPAYGMPG